MGQYLHIGFIKSIHVPQSSNGMCSEVKLREEMDRRFNRSLFNETASGDGIDWHINHELFSDMDRVAEFLERQWINFYSNAGTSEGPLDPEIGIMTAAIKGCQSYNDLAEIAARPYASYLFQESSDDISFGKDYSPLKAQIMCQTFISTGKAYLEEWRNLFAYFEQALKAAHVEYACAKAIRIFLL